MTMVASFMPSLAFAASETDPLDAQHEYLASGTVTNSTVKGWLNSATNKAFVGDYTPATCAKEGSVVVKCKKDAKQALCTETKTLVVSKDNHSWKDVRVSVEEYGKLQQAVKNTDYKNDAQTAQKIKSNKKKGICYIETQVCEECGIINTAYKHNKAQHENPVAADADCKDTFNCGVCGEEVKKAANTRKLHSFESAHGVVSSVAKPASEKKVGCKDSVTVKTYVCTGCGTTKEVSTGVAACKIFKTPISVVESKDGLNLYKSGTSVVVATRENKTAEWTAKPGYKVSEILANTVYAADTTVVEDGKTYYAFTCNECGYVLKGTEVTTASTEHTKHTLEKVTEPATCTEAATEALVCTECGKYAKIGTTDAKFGSYDDAKSVVKDANGQETTALGHKLNVVKVDATCAVSAHYVITCTACDEYDETKVFFDTKASKYLDPKTGVVDGSAAYGDMELTYLDPAVKSHKFTKKVVLKEATCEVGELAGYKCETCGKMNVHNVTETAGTKLGHDYPVEKVEATCLNKAYEIKGACSRCGYELPANVTANTKAAKDAEIKDGKHAFDKWVVTKPSTVFEEGVKTLTCSACGVEHESTKTVIAKAKYAAPAVKAGKKSATVTVKATADAVSYKISYKKAGGSYKTIAAKAGKKTIKKLAKGKKYTFKAIAVNAEGVEVASATKTVKVK